MYATPFSLPIYQCMIESKFLKENVHIVAINGLLATLHNVVYDHFERVVNYPQIYRPLTIIQYYDVIVLWPGVICVYPLFDMMEK